MVVGGVPLYLGDNHQQFLSHDAAVLFFHGVEGTLYQLPISRENRLGTVGSYQLLANEEQGKRITSAC